jgi:alcohol dehydrogenase YqhD (iron-dependent ADH family)
MPSLMRQFVRVATAGTLAVVFTIPQDALAENHVVSLAELQSAAIASTAARQKNIETLREFVSSPTAEKALKSAHIDAEQVKTAVSRLSDQELAQLASRTSKAQADFAAGSLSDRDLIIILVCIAAVILIIVAVR